MRSRWHLAAFFGILAVFLSIGAFLLIQSRSKPPPHQVDQVMHAMARYADSFRQAGKPIPPSVGMEQLITLGFLSPKARHIFPGGEVTLFLDAKESEPQGILAICKHKDGVWSALISDGSIQQLSPGRLQEQIRISNQTNRLTLTN